MKNIELLIQLRKKKTAILLANARKNARRTIEDCANLLSITEQQYQSYEDGKTCPSLPELEILAYFFNVSLNFFWGKQILAEQSPISSEEKVRLYHQLRNRIINTHLRQKCSEAGKSLKEVYESAGFSSAQAEEIENGQCPIDLAYLEIICDQLGLRIETFFDRQGGIGKWQHQQEQLNQLSALPEEMQGFVCKPVNQPYIALAKHLSELPVEKLRNIAEGLLEITF